MYQRCVRACAPCAHPRACGMLASAQYANIPPLDDYSGWSRVESRYDNSATTMTTMTTRATKGFLGKRTILPPPHPPPPYPSRELVNTESAEISCEPISSRRQWFRWHKNLSIHLPGFAGNRGNRGNVKRRRKSLSVIKAWSVWETETRHGSSGGFIPKDHEEMDRVGRRSAQHAERLPNRQRIGPRGIWLNLLLYRWHDCVTSARRPWCGLSDDKLDSRATPLRSS